MMQKHYPSGLDENQFYLPSALHEIEVIARQNRDSRTLKELATVISEHSKPEPNKSMIHKAWEIVKEAGSLNGADALLEKISAVLAI